MIICRDCGYEGDDDDFELGVDGHMTCPECDGDDVVKQQPDEEEDEDELPM